MIFLIGVVDLTILWKVFSYDLSFCLHFMLDELSIYFMLMVGTISTGVLFYSISYMEGSVLKKKFIMSMVFFIVSMLLLCGSGSIFWSMVGWDGLGLSSMFLIFFFQNWKSFNSSMLTFLSNRLGDCMIIISLGSILSSGLSWGSDGLSLFMVILLSLGALSKSAQIPFSAWLPAAMAAPTPVSSLVHSSTLVTAGVFFLSRYESFFFYKSFVFYLSFLTISLAGVSSWGEYDLKKIIALSTLSHISLMVLFISLNMKLSAIIHMIVHAFFKSLLFMIAGVVIHGNNNSQDIRNLKVSSLKIMLPLMVSLFSMFGVPFLAGFISKEVFLVFFCSEMSLVGMFIFFLAVFSTCSYSARILWWLFMGNLKSSTNQFVCPQSIDSTIFIIFSAFSLMSGSMIVFLVDWSVESTISFFLLLEKKVVFLFVFSGLVYGSLLGVDPLILGKMNFLAKKMWWISSSFFVYQKFFFSFSWKMMTKQDSKGMLDKIFILGLKNQEEVIKLFNSMVVFHPMIFFMESVMVVYFIVIFF
nr:NADH dehydrogenase subunit 5 [Osculotes curta]